MSDVTKNYDLMRQIEQRDNRIDELVIENKVLKQVCKEWERSYSKQDKKMNEEMKLPENKTCKDCVHFMRCQGLFSCQPSNTECDFHPIRFIDPTDV